MNKYLMKLNFGKVGILAHVMRVEDVDIYLKTLITKFFNKKSLIRKNIPRQVIG